MTPYQRIMRAADRGKGIPLSAAEVQQMSRDQAIYQLAENDDDAEAEWKTERAH